MLGLFKKKEERTGTVSDPREEYKKRFPKLQVEYQPEERTILAVTGANGFGGGKTHGDELWTISIGLTAWMEEDSPDIHKGEFVLSTVGDEQLLEILRRRAPRDFILKFKGRVSEDGQRLLLLDLPEPAFDPDLKAILEEQKKPVTIEEEGLGVFTLNRQVNWFEAGVDWLGTEISPALDREGQYARCCEHLERKYADGGYLRLWIPFSDNARRLEELRAVIRDRETLRRRFDKIYMQETGH